MYDLIVIGGGAAGFFTAIQFAEKSPGARILILEKSNKVLSKVKVSGGGRCNVTHACFDPKEMVGFYPRGEKELRGPFSRFLCGDMMSWLSDQGIETKMEEDGRVFPVTDSSQTIIDCFEGLCQQYEIEVKMGQGVNALEKTRDGWIVNSAEQQFNTRSVMMATGSTPSVWKWMAEMEYEIVPPVPSLFTFNIDDQLLEGLPGLSMPETEVRIVDTPFSAVGPLLITHWGLSGPAVLKLSAWAARELHAVDYKFNIEVNWIGISGREAQEQIDFVRDSHGKRIVKNSPMFGMPKRLWERICMAVELDYVNYASLSAVQMNDLIDTLIECPFEVEGKSTFKEEFVTCGGIERKQIDFKTMQSKLHPGLYFAGEIIDIDAVTGGFNFQAAWTESWIAAEAMVTSK